MEPLIITAQTPHGVVLSRPWGIALDALLASVIWHRRKMEARATGSPWARYDPGVTPATIPLPLLRCGSAVDDDWHWMATFSDQHPHVEQPETRWRTGRTDHTRLQQLSPDIPGSRVSDRRGRYQFRSIPILAHPVTHLTWRAVGDPMQIEELLIDLPAVGKHTGSGEGVVSAWTVEADTTATWWAAGHEHEPGILGRPTPRRCLAELSPDTQRSVFAAHFERTTAVHPPYLHPSTQRLAFEPHR